MLQTRISPSRTSPISRTVLTTRATPSTTPGDAAVPRELGAALLVPRPLVHALGRDAPEHDQRGVLHHLGHRADGRRRRPVREPLEQLAAGARRSAASTSGRAVAAGRPREEELVERRVHLEPGELEDVVAVLEEAVRDEQVAELADLVPPARQEPVVADELVLLDVREDGAREREQLLEPFARVVVEERARTRSARRSRSLRRCGSVGRSMSSPALSAATCPISDAYGIVGSSSQLP